MVGTVPTSKRLLVGTVPTSKRLLVGTVNLKVLASEKESSLTFLISTDRSFARWQSLAIPTMADSVGPGRLTCLVSTATALLDFIAYYF